MPLEFRGVAIVDPKRSAVRFAGYPKPGKDAPIIICEIQAGALRYLGKVTDPSEDALVAAFDKHRADIESMASAIYDRGELRPKITLNEVVKAAAENQALKAK
ncbi:MAG: DUF1488 family protein [Burkholderiales bacterium]